MGHFSDSSLCSFPWDEQGRPTPARWVYSCRRLCRDTSVGCLRVPTLTSTGSGSAPGSTPLCLYLCCLPIKTLETTRLCLLCYEIKTTFSLFSAPDNNNKDGATGSTEVWPGSISSRKYGEEMKYLSDSCCLCLLLTLLLFQSGCPSVCLYMWVFTVRISFTRVLFTSEVPELLYLLSRDGKSPEAQTDLKRWYLHSASIWNLHVTAGLRSDHNRTAETISDQWNDTNELYWWLLAA